MPSRKKSGSKSGSKNKSVGASRGHSSYSADARRQGGNITSRAKQAKQSITPNRSKGFAGGKRPYDYSFYEKEEATPEYMQRLFDQYEFKVTRKQLDMFWLYYCLLRDRNAELDLTRIMGIEATVLKHFVDSAIIPQLIEFKGPLLDIGTGPGFPGAPIAICNPKMHVILAESRGKRVGFLEELTKKLGLKNTSIFSRSVKADSPFVALGENNPGGKQEVCSVISRALEVIPATLERVQNYIPAGGKVIFMKGPNCGQEVTDSQQGFKGIYKMSDDVRYTLPHTNQQRRLVAFEKREG